MSAVATLKRLAAFRPGGGSRSGRSYAITLLTPVAPGSQADLAELLSDFGIGNQSPLARLPHVHFARWVVLDQLKSDWPGAPSPPLKLASCYLLFTASVTAPDDRYAARLPRSFFEEMRTRIPTEVDAIWKHCLRYPGTADPERFAGYFVRSQLETSLFYVGYPDVTVDEVRHALAGRDSLIAFALEHQSERDPQQLQSAYLEESAAWFPSS